MKNANRGEKSQENKPEDSFRINRHATNRQMKMR